MSKTPKKDLDEDLVRQMTLLLEETGLTEIEYGRDGWHIRVAKNNGGARVSASSGPAAQELPPASAAGAVDAEPPIDEANAVTSPMVGIVYTAPETNAEPFVKVGDEVAEGQTLLLIEAMKVFNPITAPKAGQVTRILVTNETPVEFGEPLLILE